MSGKDLLNALIDRREKDEIAKAALETLQCLSVKNINLSLLCQQVADSAREMRDKYEPSRRFRWEDKVGRYDVRCLNTACEIMPSTRVYDKAEDAAEAWNRRADQPRRIDGQSAGITAEQFDSIYEETD